jgi:hypothetical protein
VPNWTLSRPSALAIHNRLRYRRHPDRGQLGDRDLEGRRHAGRPDFGRVRAGAHAFLIAYREDPTKDLVARSTIEAVIIDGKLYRRADLNLALAAWGRHFDDPLFDAISTRVARETLDKAALRNY